MKKYKTLILVSTVVIFILVFCIWQNNDIVVTNYNYRTNQISEGLDGFKIAQISDLHNKEFGKKSKRLLKILEREDPNIIVITGDLIDSRRTDITVALEFIKGAAKLAPIYYVTGNHEYRLNQNNWDRLMQGMMKYQVRLLDNRIFLLEKEKGGIYLIGLGANNLADTTLNTLCSYTDKDKLQIVLAHGPQYIDHYSQSEADLVLVGHVHGGQFRLPFIGGLIAPDQGIFPKYTAGAYKVKDTTMIVNRGMGNSIIPVRIFNRPEVVIVKLSKE